MNTDLMRRRGVERDRQNNLRLAKYAAICEQAHLEIEGALKSMEACFRNNDRAGWVLASHEFDKGLALYQIADLVLTDKDWIPASVGTA